MLRLDKQRLSLHGVLSVDKNGRLSVTPKSNKNATTGIIRDYNGTLSTKLGRNHYENMCDKIDKRKDKDLVALLQAHVDHMGVGSTTKKAHMPWVIIKHKKKSRQ